MAMNPETRRNLINYLRTFVTEQRDARIQEVLSYRTRHVTVVIEDLFQTQNISAVMRTCECYGVQDVHVHHCWMRGNDRGLRVKTRRGRGEQGVIDRICFSDVRMEGVKTPLVINSMYFCDPDGHSDFVQSRDPHSVDSTTPAIGEIVYERVLATDCQTCVAYLLGLPEQPIRKVSLLDCQFSFSPDAQPSVPAMAEGVPAISRQGIIAHFVSLLRQEQVEIIGLDPSASVHPDG